MMSFQARKRLADDHTALDEVLKELRAALKSGDLEAVHSLSDLFWARLAVHIRAEHLQLFPAIIDGFCKATSSLAGAPTLREAQSMITSLREDHNRFMFELARAIYLVRQAPAVTSSDERNEKLALVGDLIRDVEKELAAHNKIEEDGIYNWIRIVLSDQQQAELATRINDELTNRPPRFSQTTWVRQWPAVP